MARRAFILIAGHPRQNDLRYVQAATRLGLLSDLPLLQPEESGRLFRPCPFDLFERRQDASRQDHPQGNKWVCWAFVEAVAPVIATAPQLRARYQHPKFSGTNKARVAIARELFTAAFQILRDRRPYERRGETNKECAPSTEIRTVLMAYWRARQVSAGLLRENRKPEEERHQVTDWKESHKLAKACVRTDEI